MKRIVILAVMLALMLALAAPPASAEWILHPYPNVGYWWCDYYYDGGPYEGYTYWCNPEGTETWFRAAPGWQYRT